MHALIENNAITAHRALATRHARHQTDTTT